MKSKVPFVTGGLHRIGGQIADANAKRSLNPADAQAPAPQEQLQDEDSAPSPAEPEPQAPGLAVSKQEPEKAAPKQEANEALLQRHEELRRLKRDILARLAEQKAAMQEELSLASLRSKALEELKGKCESLTEAIATLPDPQPGSKDYSRSVADACRIVEHARLELIMAQTKLEKLPGSSQEPGAASKSGSRDSILPELNSLGNRQLLRFGLLLTAPIAGAVIVSGFIIALAIILAIRVF